MVMNKEKRKVIPINEAVRKRVKAAMYEKGMTIAELADKIGSSSASIWRMISGNYPIDSLNMILKLSTALEIPLSEMLQLSFEEILGEKITIVINPPNYEEQSFEKENVIKEISRLIMNSNLNNTEIGIILELITAYVKYREHS